MAAALARRSVRTISRAYRGGTLRAYRDGNGRGVRIRFGDLRQWMMATTVAASAPQQQAEHFDSPLERADMGGSKVTARGPSENLTLLNAARARRRGGGASGGGASSRSEGPAGARPA
jgi:hypothetical protein